MTNKELARKTGAKIHYEITKALTSPAYGPFKDQWVLILEDALNAAENRGFGKGRLQGMEYLEEQIVQLINKATEELG